MRPVGGRTSTHRWPFVATTNGHVQRACSTRGSPSPGRGRSVGCLSSLFASRTATATGWASARDLDPQRVVRPPVRRPAAAARRRSRPSRASPRAGSAPRSSRGRGGQGRSAGSASRPRCVRKAPPASVLARSLALVHLPRTVLPQLLGPWDREPPGTSEWYTTVRCYSTVVLMAAIAPGAVEISALLQSFGPTSRRLWCT